MNEPKYCSKYMRRFIENYEKKKSKENFSSLLFHINEFGETYINSLAYILDIQTLSDLSNKVYKDILFQTSLTNHKSSIFIVFIFHSVFKSY